MRQSLGLSLAVVSVLLGVACDEAPERVVPAPAETATAPAEPPAEIRPADLALIVLPIEAYGDLAEGLKIDPATSGPLDTSNLMLNSEDPPAAGWAATQGLALIAPELRFDGVFVLGSFVDQYETAEEASPALEVVASTWEGSVVEMELQGATAIVDSPAVPDLGDDSVRFSMIAPESAQPFARNFEFVAFQTEALIAGQRR